GPRDPANPCLGLAGGPGREPSRVHVVQTDPGEDAVPARVSDGQARCRDAGILSGGAVERHPEQECGVYRGAQEHGADCHSDDISAHYRSSFSLWDFPGNPADPLVTLTSAARYAPPPQSPL